MKHPSEYPAGWRRSVANEHHINEIVRKRIRSGADLDETSTSDAFEFWGEVAAAFCVVALPIVLLFIFYVWG